MVRGLKRLAAGFSFAILVSALGTFAQAQSGDELLDQARTDLVEKGPRIALPGFERALIWFQEKKERHGEALALGAIGNCYERLADYDRALDYLHRSLKMKQELGDRLEEGKTLGNLGLVFWDVGDYPKALDHLTRSLAIAREAKDRRLEGTALNNLGLVSDEQGDYSRSLKYYQEALELHRATNFSKGETDTLGNIGGVYLLSGRYREAQQYYQRALEIDERLDLKPSVCQDLGNLALCQIGLGDLREAIRTFDRALEIARETHLAKEEADWHKGKGSALAHVGRYDLARAEYRQALQRYEEAGLKRELVEALIEMAGLNLLMGDSLTAEKDFRRAIEIARSIGHERGVIINLIALGDLESRSQRFDQAGALYLEAFDRAREADDQGAMAESLVALALTLRDEERLEEAHPKAQKALEIARACGARIIEAKALYALGELGRRGGDLHIALENYAAGEQIAQATGDTELSWQLAYGKGQALEALERDEESLSAYRDAVEIIEGVRNQLRDDRFRAGYLEDKYQVYVALVRLLLKKGRLHQAFLCSERLRAQSYSDLLRSGVPLVTDPKEAELRARIRQLQESLEHEYSRASSQQRAKAKEFFSIELAAAEREYQALRDDREIHHSGPSDPFVLEIPDVEQVQAELPADAALVEYVVGAKSLVIFVLTKSELQARTVAVQARELRARIELFRDLVASNRTEEWVVPARGLSGLLIEPVLDGGWLRGVTRLWLVPHSVLHYLPFAVLPRSTPDGARFLVQDFELTYLPAASALVYGRKTGNWDRKFLALAPTRTGLRYAQREAYAIGTLFPQRSLVLLGRNATEKSFKRQAGSYQTIHLATHGFFDKLNPMFSGVQLEPDAQDDGRLQVHEILQLRLQARLITLSACETALQSGYFADFPAGDEFVGLTRAFLSAGGSSVLASLWEVNDRSTSYLMQDFYRNLGKSDIQAALAQAQRAMLRSGGRYRHPSYWAPFVLVGATK